MYILLAAATQFEISPALQLLETNNFIVNQHEVEVLITGIGQTAATYLLTYNLQNKRPDLVIQAGIAGSFSGELKLGETVLIQQDTFGDLGIEDKGIFSTLFDEGLADKNNFPFTNGWLINDHPVLKKTSLAIVKAVTVNKVSDNLIQEKQLTDHFSPQAESMEGAALHFVCLQENVPFIQIRSISNVVGERDKSKWKIKEAITNLNGELQKLFFEL